MQVINNYLNFFIIFVALNNKTKIKAKQKFRRKRD